MDEQDQVADQAPEAQPLEEILNGIQGEDGRQKYADAETALKSIPHKDEHIAKLESELAELRDKAQGAQSMQEAVEQLRNEFKQTSQPSESPDQGDLTKIVDERLQAREVETKQKANVGHVLNEFNEKFGDKATEEFKAVADRNGLNLDFLKDLARKSPEAVFNLAGIKSKGVAPPKSTGSINTESFQQQPKPTQQPKKVMYGASTKDMLDAWRHAGDIVNNT